MIPRGSVNKPWYTCTITLHSLPMIPRGSVNKPWYRLTITTHRLPMIPRGSVNKPWYRCKSRHIATNDTKRKCKQTMIQTHNHTIHSLSMIPRGSVNKPWYRRPITTYSLPMIPRGSINKPWYTQLSLYRHSIHNDKFLYNDNLTVTKP